ncbi:hypothetical protein ACVIGB_000426 [Bradyrhizobium sp. USDA 4341]
MAAIRMASEFVFIDGLLHRRVGPPVAVSAKNGYPILIQSDQYAEYLAALGPEANFLPIQHADLLL